MIFDIGLTSILQYANAIAEQRFNLVVLRNKSSRSNIYFRVDDSRATKQFPEFAKYHIAITYWNGNFGSFEIADACFEQIEHDQYKTYGKKGVYIPTKVVEYLKNVTSVSLIYLKNENNI